MYKFVELVPKNRNKLIKYTMCKIFNKVKCATIVVAALLGMSACSSDDPTENYLVDEVKIMSRAADGVLSYKGEVGESMMLYIRKDVSVFETEYLECTESSDGLDYAKWERLGGELYSTLLPAEVYAVYMPYRHYVNFDSEAGRLIAIVPKNQSAKEALDSLDLQFAYDDRMSADDALALNFQHVFTKVKINVAYAGYFVDIKPSVNGILVKSCGEEVEYHGKRMAAIGESTDVSACVYDNNIDVYLAPGEYKRGDAFVSLILEDYKSSMEQANCDILIDCCRECLVSLPSDTEFESGKEYEFVLVLSPEGATLQPVGSAVI